MSKKPLRNLSIVAFCLIFIAIALMVFFSRPSFLKNKETLLAQGRNFYLKKSRPEKALAIFQTLTRQNPQETILWVEQANVAILAGETALALDSLKKAQELNPDFSQRHEIALLYQNAKRYDTTLELLNLLAGEDPKNATVVKDRGILLYLMGHEDKAGRDLQKSLSMEPGLLSAVISLGAILEQQGRVQKAQNLYASALKTQPSKGEEGWREKISLQLKKLP